MTCTGVRACVGLVVAATMVVLPLAAQAQQKQHSDRSVTTLMDYTWSTMPNQFRHPNGEVIVIDKTKRKDIEVPLEKARMVVGVADLSARAGYCGLPEEQNANFQTMMLREQASKQWSSQQLTYMTLLHATVVAYMTGNVKFQFGETGQKDVEITQKGPVWKEPCTDADREKIRARIMAYIQENQPAKRAEPAGTQKK